MTVKYEYTHRDFVELSRLLPFKIGRASASLLVLFASIYGLILCQRPNLWSFPFKSEDLAFLVIAGAAVGFVPLLTRGKVRSVYRQKLTAALLGLVEITITDTGCRFATPQSDTTMNWGLFDQQVETAHFIALRAKSGGIRPFPKAAFTAQELAEFRAVIGNIRSDK
jgi:hypothetical protein